jgi:negative regulator of flagellin synthesis FlgM
MRVDAYNKVAQIYQTNATNKIAKTTSVKAKDQVEISRMGKDYQIAKQAVANTPDIRQDKVDEIKKRLESGTYNMNAEEVASKLVDSYFDNSI